MSILFMRDQKLIINVVPVEDIVPLPKALLVVLLDQVQLILEVNQLDIGHLSNSQQLAKKELREISTELVCRGHLFPSHQLLSCQLSIFRGFSTRLPRQTSLKEVDGHEINALQIILWSNWQALQLIERLEVLILNVITVKSDRLVFLDRFSQR